MWAHSIGAVSFGGEVAYGFECVAPVAEVLDPAGEESTFDGEIVRWPCKGKSKTGKQPRQVMSLGAVQRMRPERNEIIVCTGVKIAGAGIQYWGSYAVWGHMLRR